ncbi:uncharacterized protein MAM_02605 [Metarhizium album ARSEF 1941]|uniref:Copper acquisition factor BIM1-like domain-containing protein n=1 Tax=Metarhizium album (strain ARSEF 1941) TaxID=1081103 RepID=A0A0B2X228_METAS|nr:uncharacterized protein MAM_02605 [Metarhizium album ARSEF 1941]KHN99752.1 hypothetical protein MAM_02605 [Metarhizium album ARSEF 1941]
MKSFVLLSALCGLGSAHFLLNYPESLGFEDKNEDQGPCGGFKADFSKRLQDFHVDGDAIAVKLTHAQGNWLFRVTTDEKAESGWEQTSPIVQQSGLGDFCKPDVVVPAKYAGKKGILSVVSSATDGLLFQCAALNFVQGKGDKPSACRNSSSVKVSFTDDAKLTALVGNSSSGTATSASGSGSQTSASSTATHTGAASSLRSWYTTGAGWGGALAVLSLAMLGGALMI